MSPFLPEFEHFLVLAQTQNISRAAELVGVKQSGLSKSLQRMEKKWGTPLFSRSKQGLHLTSEGKKAFRILSDLKNKWSSSLREGTENVEMGSVKLGCHSLIAQTALHRFHPRIVQTYPGIFLEVELERSLAVTRKVITADLDIGIVANPQRHPDLVIHLLESQKVCLWKGKEFKKTEKILYYNPELMNVYSYVKDFPDYRQIPITDYITIAALIRKTAVTGILPSPIGEFIGGLEVLEDFSEASMCLIYRKDRAKTRIMQTVISEIKTGFL